MMKEYDPTWILHYSHIARQRVIEQMIAARRKMTTHYKSIGIEPPKEPGCIINGCLYVSYKDLKSTLSHNRGILWTIGEIGIYAQRITDIEIW